MSNGSLSRSVFMPIAVTLLLAATALLTVATGNAFAVSNTYVPTSEDVQLAKSDPSAENSFRYSDGVRVAGDDPSDDGGMGLFKVVTSGGYKYFDTFDTFKKGYCTGVGAYRGIDVSEHQKSINWTKVKNAGIDFAIIRCGYGSNIKTQDDKYWLQNVKGCITNKIPFGVYIYSYATNTTRAKSEANHVLRCLNAAGLGPSDLSYPIYFDMEDSSTIGCNYANLAKTFCTAIQNAGYSAGVYSSTSWWKTRLTSSTFNNYHKWVAEFNTTIGLTYSGVSNFSSGNGIWQFTSMGKVSGITSNTVDLNYTYIPPKSMELMADTFVTPSTPYAKTVSDGEYIIYSHSKTTMVATVKNGATTNNANIHLGSSDMTGKQRFRITRDPATGFYTIANSSNGKVFGLTKSGSTYLTNLAQRTLDPSDNSQKWIITNPSSQKFVIKNAANSKFVMSLSNSSATNGSNIQVSSWKAVNAQRWGLASTTVNVPKSSATIKTGTYTLALSKKTSRVVEVNNGSTSKGANIQLNASDKSIKQKFKIENDGDGYYHIRSAISGKAIEPVLGNLVPKTNVHLASYSKSAIRQKWSVRKSGGKYIFTNRANGHVLEVNAGSTSKKANIQTNRSGATTAQSYVLKTVKATKTVKTGSHTIKLSKKTTMGLAVKKDSKLNRAKTRLATLSSVKSGKYTFYFDKKTGYYTIKNKRSGKYLEITGLKCASGKTIRQAKKSSSYAQRWIITKYSKGKYIIKSALNPEYVIDAGKSKAKSGNSIRIYKRNKSRLQIWRL